MNRRYYNFTMRCWSSSHVIWWVLLISWQHIDSRNYMWFWVICHMHTRTHIFFFLIKLSQQGKHCNPYHVIEAYMHVMQLQQYNIQQIQFPHLPQTLCYINCHIPFGMASIKTDKILKENISPLSLFLYKFGICCTTTRVPSLMSVSWRRWQPVLPCWDSILPIDIGSA